VGSCKGSGVDEGMRNALQPVFEADSGFSFSMLVGYHNFHTDRKTERGKSCSRGHSVSDDHSADPGFSLSSCLAFS
jgi:hypothetical protein